ncbi:hypothetical protein GW17_00053186 [Ensete ventricosum]|nr:hypothetical protein GW17_00053186 [Ensete ventricosum]
MKKSILFQDSISYPRLRHPVCTSRNYRKESVAVGATNVAKLLDGTNQVHGKKKKKKKKKRKRAVNRGGGFSSSVEL